ncbi:helix-turn-helix domain-containing protein, partial [Andreprevotia lacus]
MNQRKELVLLALQEGTNRRELARRMGLSPKTLYKWLARYTAQGEAGLHDQSRRPHSSPRRTEPDLEQRILSLRDDHPVWG